ncbi:disulfide bond formation protein B [Shewanella chilikensis]|uniref:disulfide bond formation protein B n=1 Tax=Shewanella chilikensis TaxID=558541 RepID=UPI003A9826D7
MNKLSMLFREFSQAPVPTLARWQQGRILWSIMLGAAVFLLASAMGYFQVFLEMDPCELCVYIRFSQCCIVLAGAIILINPKNHLLKALGVALALYGVIQGMAWSIQLMNIHDAAHLVVNESMDFFAEAGSAAGSACSTEPHFPLGLPLDKWLPFEFAPTGGCGEDDWSLFGMNMAHYCIIAYSVFAIGLGGAIVGWLASFKAKP